MTTIDELPRPGRPGAILGLEYWLSPERFFDDLDGVGERFVIKIPGLPTWVCTTSPEDVKTIFTKGQESLRMAEVLRRFAPHEPLVGGDSLIFLDGKEHQRERRTLAPPFHGDRLKAFEPTMVRVTEEHLGSWPVDRPVEVVPLLQELTLDVIIEVIFGVTEGDRAARLREAIAGLDGLVGSWHFTAVMVFALARKGNWPGAYGNIRNAVKRVDDVVLEEIAHRRREGAEDRDDFLAMYMRTGADGEVMDDARIAQNMRGLLLGGHETTTLSIGWMIERLTRHPDVLNTLQAGVDAGDDDYLDAVIAESMRLRPVAPFTGRWVESPFMLGDLEVPAGVAVVPFITLLHRRADIYPDPLSFRPERFLGVRPGTYTWLPFGGGAHRCLGGAFAMLEMRVVMRTILRERTLQATGDAGESMVRRHFAVAPGRGGVATFAARAPVLV